MLPRFITGLLIGALASLLIAVAVVLPAVLIIRLVWGVWPAAAGWRWIAGVLAGQTLALAVRHALMRSKDGEGGPTPRPDDHASSPP